MNRIFPATRQSPRFSQMMPTRAIRAIAAIQPLDPPERRLSSLSTAAPRTLTGIALALAGWAVFSLQDAIVKWLVVKLPVPEVLFARSVIVMVVAGLAMGRADYAALLVRRNAAAIALRAMLILLAWLAFYGASRSLPLGQLVTLYFAAPLFIVVLSRPLLGEFVGLRRWLATLAGFGGVVIAADINGTPDLWPAAMTLFAALCWALTSLLARSLTRSVRTVALMAGSSLIFALACLVIEPWTYAMPDAFSLGLMLALGVIGCVGQWLLFEAVRLASPSALAPFEYSSLLWATLWGWTVFGDLPRQPILIGAAIILACGLYALYGETRARTVQIEA
jgi:S-adenosylmethionine uptake transporter